MSLATHCRLSLYCSYIICTQEQWFAATVRPRSCDLYLNSKLVSCQEGRNNRTPHKNKCPIDCAFLPKRSTIIRCIELQHSTQQHQAISRSLERALRKEPVRNKGPGFEEPNDHTYYEFVWYASLTPSPRKTYEEQYVFSHPAPSNIKLPTRKKLFYTVVADLATHGLLNTGSAQTVK